MTSLEPRGRPPNPCRLLQPSAVFGPGQVALAVPAWSYAAREGTRGHPRASKGVPRAAAWRAAVERLVQAGASILEAVSDAMARRRGLQELMALDDHMLADVGLRRTDLPSTCSADAYGELVAARERHRRSDASRHSPVSAAG